MQKTIRVAILDDHQAIIDGYTTSLNNEPDIEVVGTLNYGQELEAGLNEYQPDVLLLDVHVPNSAEDTNPFPILFILPRLIQVHPNLAVLVISMHSHKTLIKAIMEAGASGYILKNDQAAYRELPSIIRSIAGGGIYLSSQAYQQLAKFQPAENSQQLTNRQIEALSLCAAYPDASTAEISREMNVANSTVRNLLSSAYIRLQVHTRAAAVAKARQMGLITPNPPSLDLHNKFSANG